MELRLKKINDINNIIKGTLYKVDKDTEIKFKEEHEDGTKDVVNINFQLKKDMYGIYAHEYRMPDIASSGCSKADVMCWIVDEKSLECHTYIFDVKKNISGFDVEADLKKLRSEEVKRIKDFIKQIDDEICMKNILMVVYNKKGFKEVTRVGIATREFNVDRLRILSDRLYKYVSKDNTFENNKLIEFKFKREMLPIKKEAEMVKLFCDKKIKVSDIIYDLDVYILENMENEKDYTYKLNVI